MAWILSYNCTKPCPVLLPVEGGRLRIPFSSFEDTLFMHTPFMHPVSPSFFVLESLGRRFHSKFFHRFPHHSQERLGHHM